MGFLVKGMGKITHPLLFRKENMWLRYSLITLFLFVGCAMANSPAHYIHGTTKIVETFTVNSEGGSFRIENTNTPVDGLLIEVPSGSFRKHVIVSIGYNNGRLKLRTGQGSGVILVLEVSDNITSFEKPFKITAHFDPSIKPMSIIGYIINEKGSLRPLDTISKLKAQGVVAFYTFKPLMFTWVYVLK